MALIHRRQQADILFGVLLYKPDTVRWRRYAGLFCSTVIVG